MAAPTLYRLAEETLKMISGGEIQTATNISLNEVKIAIGQVANTLLKAEQFSVNEKMGEKIPNGTMLSLYEGIAVYSNNGKSKFKIPIKPIKLPRNMGVFSVYAKVDPIGNYDYDNELIPLQMGQGGLLKSEKLISDLLGQTGYELFGDEGVLTQDLKGMFPDVVLAMRLVIMDISLYGDYDPLPILPEMEFQIKQEVFKMFTEVGIADVLVDPSTKLQQNIPVAQQKQS